MVSFLLGLKRQDLFFNTIAYICWHFSSNFGRHPMKTFRAGLGGLILALSLYSLSFAQSIQGPLPPLLPAGGQANSVEDRRAEFLAKQAAVRQAHLFSAPSDKKGLKKHCNFRDFSFVRSELPTEKRKPPTFDKQTAPVKQSPSLSSGRLLDDPLPTVTISSDITTNTIWSASNIYHVTVPVQIQALLVIEPGTTGLLRWTPD